MIEHFLLFSRYVGNRGPNLRSRDFKLTNECVYPSFSFLLTSTARKSKGSHLNYFFIHKLEPRYSSISKTVKTKGCERPAYKFLARASEQQSNRATEQQSNRVTQSNKATCRAQQSNRATEQQSNRVQSIRASEHHGRLRHSRK